LKSFWKHTRNRNNDNLHFDIIIDIKNENENVNELKEFRKLKQEKNISL